MELGKLQQQQLTIEEKKKQVSTNSKLGNKRSNDKTEVVYWTQKELAIRWRVSESTVKSYRDNGDIPFFSPPGSSRVLYPKDDILTIEADNLTLRKKEEYLQKQPVVIKRKKPVVSSKSTKKWRI